MVIKFHLLIGQGTLYDYPDYEAIIISKNFD